MWFYWILGFKIVADELQDQYIDTIVSADILVLSDVEGGSADIETKNYQQRYQFEAKTWA